MLGFGLHLTGGARPGEGGSATFVFLLIGQSNMVGRAGYDGGSLHPAGTRQWGRQGADNGQLIPATAPLQHHDPNNGQMGLDIAFAEAFVATYPGTDLVLVPSADGGTGFSANRWNPGDDLYLDAVARANAVMAANPAFRFAGILWHQGESDVGFAGYQDALDAMIAAMRQDIVRADDATPFILGGMVPGWVAGATARQTSQAIIEDTPNRVARTGFAPSDGLTSAGGDIHFTGADLRGLGAHFHTAWQDVFTGAVPPEAQGQIPDQTDLLPASGPAGPGTQGQIPNQTDTLAAPTGPTAPEAQGQIPDQTDQIALAAPQAQGQIPDQEDTSS